LGVCFFVAIPSFDPLVLPIVSVSSDPAIAPELLTAELLQSSFFRPKAWSPEINEEQNMRTAQGTLTAASVLIPLVVREDGIRVLLTQRTAHLSDHAGQVSFPGGRAEQSDDSVIETALRETEEEIGLARSCIEILGVLPDYCTGTGYRISPVAALVHPPFEIAADPFEVAEIFEVPLSFLMNPANHQTRRLVIAGGERIFYAMPYGRHFIWGATAGMLRNLYRFIAAQIDL
jgi:8-oxo-dGTP pyrophosphatase MutT (NUDIX family)